MKQDVGIGLLGLGTVGSAVADVLLNKADKLAEQVGASLILRKVLVRDTSRQRAVHLEHGVLSSQVEEVVNSPDVDIVIELIGGESPALEYIKQAITRGKHVVTANKEVIAKYGYRLLSLAQEHNVDLRYEATVGSGIPLISPGLLKLSQGRKLSGKKVVCVLTGTGLKDPGIPARYAQPPTELPADLAVIEKALGWG